MVEADYFTVPIAAEKGEAYIPKEEIPALIQSLEREMREAASRLEFERAAELRDRIREFKEMEIELGGL
jgi:excinuclease ABC subunit B